MCESRCVLNDCPDVSLQCEPFACRVLFCLERVSRTRRGGLALDGIGPFTSGAPLFDTS